MLPILVGLGSIAGIFCLWAFRHVEKAALEINRELCHIRHRAGPVTVRHYKAISCEWANETAQLARATWCQLEARFPGQSGRFTVYLIFEPKRVLVGRRVRDKMVVNLANMICVDDLQVNEGNLRVDVNDLWDTLAEEIFHLCWRRAERRAEIKPQRYLFKPRGPLSDEDVVKYYALNPHEYQALCFAVALVGKRAKLLEEVEEYRALHGIK